MSRRGARLMIDTLVQWAGTLWGTAVLVALAWCVLSFLFCFTLGRLIALLEGSGLQDMPEPDQLKRRDPRRASVESLPPQQSRQEGA